MDRAKAALIVAASGRALAASARRGGMIPLVADFFGDQDTIALAHAHRRLASGLRAGMQPAEVLEALEALARAAPSAPLIGVICGTGFEDRPDLLAAIAERWPLIGNGADVVARVKDPISLTAICRDGAVPHPPVALDPPVDSTGWLVKRRGGAGGSHVKAQVGRERAAGTYFQQRVAGAPVSALVLAESRRAMVLGWSAQWSAAAPDRPFRYGGAVTPAGIAPHTAAMLAESVACLMAKVPLVGLNSVDFLLDRERFWLMEVNPRPGATLDLFEPADGSLFALHVAACAGALPAHLRLPLRAKAAAVVYAERDIPIVPDCAWPDWTADRPLAGSAVKAGEPLCTVVATAATAAQAKRLVAGRMEAILSRTCEKAA